MASHAMRRLMSLAPHMTAGLITMVRLTPCIRAWDPQAVHGRG